MSDDEANQFNQAYAELKDQYDRLQAENERLKEGEQWAASKFCEIMAVAVSGFADAAIVAEQKLTADHSLAAVVKLKEHAATLKAESDALKDKQEDLLAKNNRLADAADKAEFEVVQLRKESDALKRENAELKQQLTEKRIPVTNVDAP